MAPNLKLVKPSTEAEKATRTTSDTWEVTPNDVKAWKLPPFQRPLKINKKVTDISEEIATNGVFPGVITLGVLGHE